MSRSAKPWPPPGSLPFQAAAEPAAQRDGTPVYTVAQLTRKVRQTLEDRFAGVWVTGEISNLRQPASGHVYLTLKDESAQLAAVIWRSTASRILYRLEDGLAVVAYGDITVYEPRGQYQLVVKRLEPKGVGALQLAFQQLKEKLDKEGLFDQAHKKPLPVLPQRIGIVTSPTGAAIRDMLATIRGRFPNVHVLLYPARVQGEGAAQEIAEGIAAFGRMPDIDVMIVGRGGGSLEDLWAFNEEVVARAIFASAVPVVSAVGHEIDFTIADFVADRRALTPTDAGMLVVPDMAQIQETLSSFRHRVAQSLLSHVERARQRLDAVARTYAFRQPFERLRRHEQRLDELTHRVLRVIGEATRRQHQRLDGISGKLDSLSPLNVLGRGYSITHSAKDGRVLRDASEVASKDKVVTRLMRGEFRSTVD